MLLRLVQARRLVQDVGKLSIYGRERALPLRHVGLKPTLVLGASSPDGTTLSGSSRHLSGCFSRFAGDPDARLGSCTMQPSRKLPPVPVRVGYLAATAVCALMLFPAGAQAAGVVVGSPLTATFASVNMCSPVCTAFDATLPEAGTHTSSPISGKVVRWHVLDASGGALRVRVLHAIGGGKYEGTAQSSFETPTSTGLQTFTTDLAIEAGELVTLENSSTSVEIGYFGVVGAEIEGAQPALPETGSGPLNLQAPGEFAFNAEVQPAPAITAVNPPSGSTNGGTSVTITGTGLEGASRVTFGGVAATTYTVNSETQITAMAPANSTPGPVDTSVTTAAGTTATSSADRFTYTAPPVPQPLPAKVSCTVPKLTGKKLKAAKKALLKAQCKLGKVKGKKSASAKVKTQKPKPGTVLTPGSKVNVTLR